MQPKPTNILSLMGKPNLDPNDFAKNLINSQDSDALIETYMDLKQSWQTTHQQMQTVGTENKDFLVHQLSVNDHLGNLYDGMKNLATVNRRKVKHIRQSVDVNETRVFEKYQELKELRETRKVLERTQTLNYLFLESSVLLGNGLFREAAKVLNRVDDEINLLESQKILGQEFVDHLKKLGEKKAQEFVLVGKEKFYKLFFGFSSLINQNRQGNNPNFGEQREDVKTKLVEEDDEVDLENYKILKTYFEDIFEQKGKQCREKTIQIEESEDSVVDSDLGLVGEHPSLSFESLMLSSPTLAKYVELTTEFALFESVCREILDASTDLSGKNMDSTFLHLLSSFQSFQQKAFSQDVKINLNMRLHKSLLVFMQFYLEWAHSNSDKLCTTVFNKKVPLGESHFSNSRSLQSSNMVSTRADQQSVVAVRPEDSSHLQDSLSEYSFLSRCQASQRHINGLVEALLTVLTGFVQKIFWLPQFLNADALNLKRVFEYLSGFTLTSIFEHLFKLSRDPQLENEMVDDQQESKQSKKESEADLKIVKQIRSVLGIERAHLFGVLPILQETMQGLIEGGEPFLKDEMVSVATEKYNDHFLKSLQSMLQSELVNHYLRRVYSAKRTQIFSIQAIKEQSDMKGNASRIL